MDPGQTGQSCPFLDKSRGAPGLHPPAMPNLPPPTPLCPTGKAGNPPGLGTAHPPGPTPQEQQSLGSMSFVSGSISISRPRPTALGARCVGKSSRTVSSSAVIPSAPGVSSPLPFSHSFTDVAQLSPTPHRSPTPSLSPTPQTSLNSLPSPLVLPSPPAQANRITQHTPNTHATHFPKSKPALDAHVSPVPQPSQRPLKTSPGRSDNSLPLHKPTSEDDGFRVHIVTWNVASAIPPDDISSLFGPGVSDKSTDMFIIGLQEVNSMISKRLKDVLSTDQWSELCMDTLSRFGYVLVASQRMQGVLLLVLSQFRHLPFLRGIQTQTTRTGLGGCWGNKGGVSARMTMFGHPVCFLNCHLPAHMRNLEQRVEDFESILQQQQFEGGAAMGVLDHDVVFWFGDLNFRIEGYDIHVVKSAIEKNKLSLLWEKDQLNMAKSSESILDGFMEGPLNFSPTYKFDVGTHTYDTSAKKRKPAWTDRILWRLRRTGSPVPSHNASLQWGLTSWLGGATKVTQHFYRSHMGFTISDHKPVSALFSLHFPFKVDLPLVTLEVEKEWTKVSDATARFTIASGFQRGSWDWVGLYKVGFKHHKDYAAYMWAKSDHLTQSVPSAQVDWNAPKQTTYCVTFPEEDLPREAGDYILGYYSNSMNSIVGITEPFQVHLPVCSAPAPVCPSHSDSSEVSSEDDSTLVLLGPSSRSPSPGSKVSGRRHHHQHQRPRHQRSRSPAVPALTSTPLPSLQGLSLRPRDGQPRSVSPRPAASAKKERLVSPDVLSSPSVSPLSPLSPGNGVSVPEALVAAIIGEHRAAPCQISTGGASPKAAGKHP